MAVTARPRVGRALLAYLLLFATMQNAALAVAPDDNIEPILETFRLSYEERLGPTEGGASAVADGSGERYVVSSPKLRGRGNYPNILHHGHRTSDVVVLIHGLTDSPYYMDAIGRRFHAAGATVVYPLLPGHGLLEPNEAMEDDELAEKWKATTDAAVEIAHGLGDRVSIGGLSTGGALAVNKALRDPGTIDGGVFLFSAALNVGTMNQFLGGGVLLAPMIAREQDGDYRGVGPNPYKYPKFSQFGGMQLTRVIKESNELCDEKGFTQPTFAVHSIHDTAALIGGIGDLFRAHRGTAIGVVLAQNPPVEHASVVLETDIELDATKLLADEELPPVPKANPNFRGVSELAIAFFHRYVQHNSGDLQ